MLCAYPWLMHILGSNLAKINPYISKNNKWEVPFDSDKIDEQIMIIYIDIFGNEKREVKSLKDFRRRK